MMLDSPTGRRILKRLRTIYSGKGVKQTDRSLIIRCPFHQERTASCKIYLDTGIYYCHGCHARGNIFDAIKNNPGFLRSKPGREIKEPDIEVLMEDIVPVSWVSIGLVAAIVANKATSADLEIPFGERYGHLDPSR